MLACCSRRVAGGSRHYRTADALAARPAMLNRRDGGERVRFLSGDFGSDPLGLHEVLRMPRRPCKNAAGGGLVSVDFTPTEAVPMSHKLFAGAILSDARLWRLLTRHDEKEAECCRRSGCPRCGGRLHSASYPASRTVCQRLFALTFAVSVLLFGLPLPCDAALGSLFRSSFPRYPSVCSDERSGFGRSVLRPKPCNPSCSPVHGVSKDASSSCDLMA